jgi:tRNA threonylcarbamoyladenosine biosynthesis protein TsaE
VTSLSIFPKHSVKPSAHKPQPGPTLLSKTRRHETFCPEWSTTLRSAGETARLGRAIGKALRGGEVLALYGLLGAGKTTLVRGIADGLEADPDRVMSPTFVLVHEYQGRLPLIHVDLYRIQSETDAASLGLDEYFNGITVTAIEWAGRSPGTLPPHRLEIRLQHRSVRTRHVLFRALGPMSVALLNAIRTGYVSAPSNKGRSRGPARAASTRRLPS